MKLLKWIGQTVVTAICAAILMVGSVYFAHAKGFLSCSDSACASCMKNEDVSIVKAESETEDDNKQTDNSSAGTQTPEED